MGWLLLAWSPLRLPRLSRWLRLARFGLGWWACRLLPANNETHVGETTVLRRTKPAVAGVAAIFFVLFSPLALVAGFSLNAGAKKLGKDFFG